MAILSKQQELIQVVIVEPLKKPYRTLIANSQEALHDIVGGEMQKLRVGSAEGVIYHMFYNIEAYKQNLHFNRRIVGHDFIGGCFVIAGTDTAGKLKSIGKKQAEVIINHFKPLEVYL